MVLVLDISSESSLHDGLKTLGRFLKRVTILPKKRGQSLFQDFSKCLSRNVLRA